jgi:hypothetical protein
MRLALLHLGTGHVNGQKAKAAPKKELGSIPVRYKVSGSAT